MRPARLLIVNPNTNALVTRWLAEEAERIAGADFDIVALSAPSGLAAIETPDHIAQASRAVVATIEADSEAGVAIIGAFGDPGLAEARVRQTIPVIGLGEAGLRAAGAGGRRFSIVTLGEAMRAPIAARVAALGLQGMLEEISVLPISISEMIAGRDEYRPQVVQAVANCAGEVVLLGGAPFAGLGVPIMAETGRMVMDGVEACVAVARRALDEP